MIQKVSQENEPKNVPKSVLKDATPDGDISAHQVGMSQFQSLDENTGLDENLPPCATNAFGLSLTSVSDPKPICPLPLKTIEKLHGESSTSESSGDMNFIL